MWHTKTVTKAILPLRAALALMLVFALHVMPAAAIAQAAKAEVAAQSTETKAAEIEQLREQTKAAVFDKTVAEAKSELIAAGNSRMEVLIGAFGVLITVLFAGFGFLTFRQNAAAASAFQAEISTIKTNMENMEKSASATKEKMEEHADVVLSAANQARIAMPATATFSDTDIPAAQHQELVQAALAVSEIPRDRRTAQDFRILMFEAKREERWQDYLDLAEGMAYLHGDNADDLASALFGKAFGQQMMKNYELASIYWADYLSRCPNGGINSRAGALYNWGNALWDQAKTKQSASAYALFDMAGEKYAAALAIKPDDHEALNNWGNALLAQAKTKHGAAADALFDGAGEKYAAAFAIKPDMHGALNNWGTALSHQAKTKQGAAADVLFDKAYEKYSTALAIKSDKHEALYNWGTALSDQAKTKHGAAADALSAGAGEKYAAVLAIKPDMHEALRNWGVALSDQAGKNRGKKRGVLLSQAEEKLLRAEDLMPGKGSYNLACVYGLCGDAAQAANWLKKAKDADINCPDCAHIAADPDFKLVRDAPEFVQALADIGC